MTFYCGCWDGTVYLYRTLLVQSKMVPIYVGYQTCATSVLMMGVYCVPFCSSFIIPIAALSSKLTPLGVNTRPLCPATSFCWIKPADSNCCKLLRMIDPDALNRRSGL